MNLAKTILLSLGISLTPIHSQAVQFVLNDTGGAAIGSQAYNGFLEATNIWSSILKDNVTVELNIGFQSLSPGVLGQTASNKGVIDYSNIFNALASDQTSTVDNSAVSNLQSPVNGLAIRRNTDLGATGVDPNTTYIDNDNSNNNNFLYVSSANLKALGFDTTTLGSIDGDITFNSDFNFDFNSNDGIAAGTYDFVGVALHEIGHALGFSSGVDTYDFYANPANTLAPGDSLNRFAIGSVLDLFRYTDNSGLLDWSLGSVPYFSLDAGASDLALFSTGRNYGDGQQASHWKDNLGIGLLDPTIAPGEFGQISNQDIIALDAIGWDLFDRTPIPVSAVIYLFSFGLLIMSLAARHK